MTAKIASSPVAIAVNQAAASMTQRVGAELVYRRELRPMIITGAEVMDKIFAPAAEA